MIIDTVTICLRKYESMVDELKQLRKGSVSVKINLKSSSWPVDNEFHVCDVNNDHLSDIVSSIIIKDNEHLCSRVNELERELSEIKNGKLIDKIKFLFNK